MIDTLGFSSGTSQLSVSVKPSRNPLLSALFEGRGKTIKKVKFLLSERGDINYSTGISPIALSSLIILSSHLTDDAHLDVRFLSELNIRGGMNLKLMGKLCLKAADALERWVKQYKDPRNDTMFAVVDTLKSIEGSINSRNEYIKRAADCGVSRPGGYSSSIFENIYSKCIQICKDYAAKCRQRAEKYQSMTGVPSEKSLTKPNTESSVSNIGSLNSQIEVEHLVSQADCAAVLKSRGVQVETNVGELYAKAVHRTKQEINFHLQNHYFKDSFEWAVKTLTTYMQKAAAHGFTQETTGVLDVPKFVQFNLKLGEQYEQAAKIYIDNAEKYKPVNVDKDLNPEEVMSD